MIRKLFCSMAVMVVVVAFVVAEESSGRILKVDGTNITFQKTKGFGKKAENVGDPVKYDAAKAKVNKAGKFNKEDKKFEVGDAIEGGLTNEIFKKLDEKKGIGARITYDGDKVSQILITGGGKKKKDAK